VAFTQEAVYTLQSYRLLQRGPIFAEDLEISMDRATGKYGVKTADIALFINEHGLLKREGQDVRIIREVSVFRRRPSIIRDFTEEEVQPEEEKTGVWKVINTLNPDELALLRCILENTRFPDSCGTNIVKLNPVKEAGYSKQQVIELLNQFADFDLHIGSNNIRIPSWWEEILPQITLPE